MSDQPTTLCEGLGHPQGPDITDKGAVIFAETYRSRLMMHEPGGKLTELLYCGGGPNAVILGAANTLYFTQNGGQAGDWRAADQRSPALERLDLSTGQVTPICLQVQGRPLLAPHDLAWGPDGSLYMTDSGTWAPDGVTEPGAIIAVSARGEVELVHDTGHVFPCGLALTADGTIYWAECYTRRVMRMRRGETPVEICTLPNGHMPESLKIDANGNFWLAGLDAEGFYILSPLGETLGFVKTGGLPLNGTLHGGKLFVTDLGPYDENETAPQMIGRLQSVPSRVGPGPRFRSDIVMKGQTP